MTVPPPALRVARSAVLFWMSPALVRGAAQSQSASKASTPALSKGFRDSIAASAADFTTSSFDSPVGTAAPMLPDLSTTSTRDRPGTWTWDFASMSTGRTRSIGVL